MALLKTFLCMCNTRTGSLLSGCYTLAISLVCLVYFLFRYVGHKLVEDSAEYKGIIYVGFVLYGFMIVSSLVLIPGVQLDKRYLLLPWIYILILVVLYDTGSVALLTTVHMEREKTLHSWEIVWLFFYLFRLAANCYCFTCVVSQYQELSDGRGTYDYFYKPRRRARFRGRGEFDIDTYDLPFGIHLPPYTEEDMTQHNPPSYSQIYPQTEQDEAQNCAGCAETHDTLLRNTMQNGANNFNTQNCTCQLCAQNYAVAEISSHSDMIDSANSSCAEGCDCCSISPHCEYCTCSQDSANNAYVDIEINPDIFSGNSFSATLNGSDASVLSSQNQRKILRYPIILKNGSSSPPLDSSHETVLSASQLPNLCDRTVTVRSDSRSDSRHSWLGRQCYEVTVNVEWI